MVGIRLAGGESCPTTPSKPADPRCRCCATQQMASAALSTQTCAVAAAVHLIIAASLCRRIHVKIE